MYEYIPAVSSTLEICVAQIVRGKTQRELTFPNIILCIVQSTLTIKVMIKDSNL